MVSYVSSQTRDGDIILVHETVPSTAQGPGPAADPAAVPGLLNWLTVGEELVLAAGHHPPGGQALLLRPEHRGEPVRQGPCILTRAAGCPSLPLAISFAPGAGFMSKNQYGEFTPNFL
ncbi:MAG: hypothetical protein ACLSCQ_11105 [Evtepia gabavorous]